MSFFWGEKSSTYTHMHTIHTHACISTCNSPKHGKQIYPNLDPVHHLLKISTTVKYISESEKNKMELIQKYMTNF